MPVKKYLEIDSTYRNRNLYPNPGSFIVNIAQGSGKTQLNATDPVSNAYSDIIFQPFQTDNLTFVLTVASGANPPYPEIASTSKTTLILTFSAGSGYEFFTTPNYFSGLVLSSKQSNDYILRRILKSTFLNNLLTAPDTYDYYFLVEIDNPIPDNMLQSTTTFKVYNPTTFTDTLFPFIFLPGSQPIDNFYNGYVVYNRDKLNYATIISFNGTTHVAGLSAITNLNWVVSDNYELKKQPPNLTGLLTTCALNFENAVDLGVEVNPNFINAFLEAFLPGTLEGALTMKIVAIIGTYIDENNVLTYTTDLQKMTDFTQCVIVDNLIVDLSANYSYQLLQFSYDNTNGFNYSGSMVSVTQPSAYELTLNSICLPNIPLSAGGNIWNYPFVYVEIENVSSSSSNSNNIIYSNNPSCNKAVFKVAIVNITNPGEYQFLTYNGNDVRQTITIKPNSDMKLTLRLPNGKIFTPLVSDTSYGQAPDTQKQLSVLISFEKI